MNKKIYIFLFQFLFLFPFLNGQEIDPNGYNKFYYENSGQIKSEGNMKNGIPVGLWKNYFEEGAIKSEGPRNNEGQLDGLWTFYHGDTCISRQISYVNGKKEGLAVQFDTIGAIQYIEYFENGIRNGDKIYFYANGNIEKIEQYQNDQLNGKVTLFAEEDGRVILEKRYNEGSEKSNIKLNRTDENGNKIGFWRDYHDNGVIKQEGYYKNGKADGIFKEYNRKGEMEGLIMYENGVLQENAEGTQLITLYREYHPDGSVKLIGGQTNGIKDGIFREYDLEGNIINGYIYKKGKLLGEGKISVDGVYQGEWVEFYENGQKKYEGFYDENGLKTGAWIFYFPNGKVSQKGNYEKGLPVKSWSWYYKNGQLKRTEYYRRGRRDGLMTEYDSSGVEIVIGNFLDGYKEGEWYYRIGDHEERGEFSMDLKQGEWKHFYFDGSLAFEGEYKDGLPIGRHKFYHENGRLKRKGKYVRGKKNKKWMDFYPNGQLKSVKVYDNGKLIMIDGVRITENQFD